MKQTAILALGVAVAACAHNNDRPAEEPSSAYGEYGDDTTPDVGDTTPGATDTTPGLGDTTPGVQVESTTPALAPASGTTTPRSSNASEPAAGSSTAASTDETTRDTIGKQPDNTGVNERDRNDPSLTPMDQGGSEADRKTTQQIRQAVMADDSLSFTAKNIKIITREGKVTLRGPVKNAQERAAIESAAARVAGAGQVDNQLEIAK
jgi:hypothetical protein